MVVLSRQIGSVNEIERWTTANGGASWSAEAITTNSVDTQVRPFIPYGLSSRDPLGVLWMAGRYPSYTTYQTRIQATR